MYSNETVIDGQQVTIRQTASGAGSRFEIDLSPGNAGFASTMLGRTRAWCSRLASEVRDAHAYARKEGAVIHIEITGANGAVDSWIPALERELAGTPIREHAGSAP